MDGTFEEVDRSSCARYLKLCISMIKFQLKETHSVLDLVALFFLLIIGRTANANSKDREPPICR